MVKNTLTLLWLLVLSSPVVIVIGLFVADEMEDAARERDATNFCNQVSAGLTLQELDQLATASALDLRQEEDHSSIYWFGPLGVGAHVCQIEFKNNLVASAHVYRWIR